MLCLFIIFQDQLCKANVMVPVIIRLEDFGFELQKEAVGFIIEFIYRGTVVIPGNCNRLLANSTDNCGGD